MYKDKTLVLASVRLWIMSSISRPEILPPHWLESSLRHQANSLPCRENTITSWSKNKIKILYKSIMTKNTHT